jgi:hypothetical protein
MGRPVPVGRTVLRPRHCRGSVQPRSLDKAEPTSHTKDRTMAIRIQPFRRISGFSPPKRTLSPRLCIQRGATSGTPGAAQRTPPKPLRRPPTRFPLPARSRRGRTQPRPTQSEPFRALNRPVPRCTGRGAACTGPAGCLRTGPLFGRSAGSGSESIPPTCVFGPVAGARLGGLEGVHRDQAEPGLIHDDRIPIHNVSRSRPHFPQEPSRGSSKAERADALSS